jgi:hypothetical protein
MFDLVNAIDSGNASELVTTIPITTGSPYTLIPIYRVQVPDVKLGDLLDFRAFGQMSNNINTEPSNTMFCHTVRAGIAANIANIELSEARGTNITRQRHHEAWEVSGFWKAPADYADFWVSLIGYAASTAAQSGWKLNVDQDFGRLQIMHFKPRVIA